MSKINGAFTTKFRAPQVEALQFTGENGKDVVEFCQDNISIDVRNGGRYIKATWSDGSSFNVTKGTVFVREEDRCYFYDIDEFRKSFVVPKNFVSVV